MEQVVLERDWRLAELERRVMALEQAAKSASYKGVTYRDGAWCANGVLYTDDDAVSQLIAESTTLTDADHAPILALREVRDA